MTRLLSLLLLVGLVGCSTGRTNTDNDLRGDLRLDAGALSANQTIVANAMTQPELSTLVAAVQRAGLVDALNGPGPFTVFAPINAAWTGNVDAMSADDLRDVLQYHVVEGDFSASELTDGMNLVTLGGEDLTIQALQALDPMMKVDDADIVYADIEASNGRIHLINLVLDPTRGSGAQ
ncbi:fasciclin domain-containing protein [Rubrivirga sp.]|uniref:fasciclin domain-containing protein n=1 Tax=Rubrivirga sp. TaxID=1885344 RepID=UPI003B51E6F9